jgi:hypothetical protein
MYNNEQVIIRPNESTHFDEEEAITKVEFKIFKFLGISNSMQKKFNLQEKG